MTIDNRYANRNQDNYFDYVFDRAVEALERKAQEQEEEEANRFF